MAWFIALIVLALFGSLGLVVAVNRFRFERRVAAEMHALTAVAPSSQPRLDASELPAPVARYRQLAVGDRAPVRTVRISHRGTFRMSPGGKDLPIEGRQLFTAEPPGFVWTGRIHIAPFVWADARDMSVAGRGSMRVLLDDTVTIADVAGANVDQGSALRLLAELIWYPTALFDARSVTWSAMDATHACAKLRLGSLEVSGVFEFGPDGLPTQMTAKRFNDKGELLPWGGVYRDWRTVSGMRVPFEAEVTWQLASGPYTYAHWIVDTVEYDDEPATEALRTAMRWPATPLESASQGRR